MATAWTVLGGGLAEALVDVAPGGDGVCAGRDGAHAGLANGAQTCESTQVIQPPKPQPERRVRFAEDTKQPGAEQAGTGRPRGTVTQIEGHDVFEITEDASAEDAALFDAPARRIAHTPLCDVSSTGGGPGTTAQPDAASALQAEAPAQSAPAAAVLPRVAVRHAEPSAFVAPAERVREMQHRRMRFQRQSEQ